MIKSGVLFFLMHPLNWVFTPFTLIYRHLKRLGIYPALQNLEKQKAALVILPSSLLAGVATAKGRQLQLKGK